MVVIAKLSTGAMPRRIQQISTQIPQLGEGKRSGPEAVIEQNVPEQLVVRALRDCSRRLRGHRSIRHCFPHALQSRAKRAQCIYTPHEADGRNLRTGNPHGNEHLVVIVSAQHKRNACKV